MKSIRTSLRSRRAFTGTVASFTRQMLRMRLGECKISAAAADVSESDFDAVLSVSIVRSPSIYTSRRSIFKVLLSPSLPSNRNKPWASLMYFSNTVLTCAILSSPITNDPSSSAHSAPVRIASSRAGAPLSCAMASRRTDFPLPDSPVIMFRPGWRLKICSSTSAKFRTRSSLRCVVFA